MEYVAALMFGVVLLVAGLAVTITAAARKRRRARLPDYQRIAELEAELGKGNKNEHLGMADDHPDRRRDHPDSGGCPHR
jgi:hypothetical protein